MQAKAGIKFLELQKLGWLILMLVCNSTAYLFLYIYTLMYLENDNRDYISNNP